MIFVAGSGDATQWVGVGGFACAGLLCARVARVGGKDGVAWSVVAVISALLTLEVVVGWRHSVHDLVVAWLINQGWYVSRRTWQVAMIAVALMALAAAGFMVRARIRSAALASAWVGMCFGVGIFVIEIISLHAVDAVLYHPVGPVLVIAVLWVAASAWVGVAALIAARR